MRWFSEICFEQVGSCGIYPGPMFVLMAVGTSLVIGIIGLAGCYMEKKYQLEVQKE